MANRISFDLLNSANRAADVKRCFADALDFSGWSITRLYGNVFIDFLIPNVSAAGITWTLSGTDDPVCIGWVKVNGRFYFFKNVLVYNETANAWRITGEVQQASPDDSFIF